MWHCTGASSGPWLHEEHPLITRVHPRRLGPFRDPLRLGAELRGGLDALRSFALGGHFHRMPALVRVELVGEAVRFKITSKLRDAVGLERGSPGSDRVRGSVVETPHLPVGHPRRVVVPVAADVKRPSLRVHGHRVTVKRGGLNLLLNLLLLSLVHPGRSWPRAGSAACRTPRRRRSMR